MRVIVPFAIVLLLLLLAGVWWKQPPANALPEPSGRQSIEGQVLGIDGPLIGARVRIKGSAQHTLSGSDGRFSLPRVETEQSVVTAAMEGYIIQSADLNRLPLRIQLEPLPAEDNVDYKWTSPHRDAAEAHNCANCHQEIYRQWMSSGHARSAKNRRLHSLLAGTSWNGKDLRGWSMAREYPEGIGVCSSCHLPSADAGDEEQFDLRLAKGVHADGVHCDYCHKIQSVRLTKQTLGRTHGRFGVRLLRPRSGQLFFGPLDDVDRGEDAYSKLQSESIYCASCHEGTLFGVHVYTTYSEWLKSPAFAAGQTCQTCHMRPNGRMTNVARGAGGIERDPQTLASHSFLPGGRLAMLRSALRVSVKWARDGEDWQVQVDLEARNVGHRVPTGFIDRHLILVVDALDGERQRLETSGPKLDTLAGDFAGRAGRLFGRVLTDAQQRRPAPFWRPPIDRADTRLWPGQSVASRFGVPGETKSLRVRLLYRRFWYSVARQKEWPDDTLVVIDAEHRR